jgi:hypothetical protein
VGGLRDRLEKLERQRQAAGQRSYEMPVYLTLYLKELENIQREESGLEPIPLTPAEESEAREADRWFLEECVPRLRELGGSPETLELSAKLEADTRAELERREKP